MQMVLRDRGLPELVEELRGKKVLIWTCNTCARLCNVGGSSQAQRIATALRSEGIEVASVMSAKAACMMSSAEDLKKTMKCDYDTILALTCEAGSKVAFRVFGAGCVNPLVTVGTGYLDSIRGPMVFDADSGKECTLEEASNRYALIIGPF